MTIATTSANFREHLFTSTSKIQYYFPPALNKDRFHIFEPLLIIALLFIRIVVTLLDLFLVLNVSLLLL